MNSGTPIQCALRQPISMVDTSQTLRLTLSICKFRHENQDLLSDAFRQVLELAARAKVLQVGDITVFIDGTKILANASKHSAVSYGHAAVEVSSMLIVCQHVTDQANDKQPAYGHRASKTEKSDRLPGESSASHPA